MSTAKRAVIFVDGNNLYHGMKSIKLPAEELDYEKLSQKLVMGREWVETRYYIGRVQQVGDLTRYQTQRKFLSRLDKCDRVNYFLGRIEQRPNKSAKHLTKWLNALALRSDISVPENVVQELRGIVEKSSQYVEKAVDVMIAIDMVSMAFEDKYDVAYLLSADGDFTSAIKRVKETKPERKVFVASVTSGYKIAQAADTFIPLNREYFHECWV